MRSIRKRLERLATHRSPLRSAAAHAVPRSARVPTADLPCAFSQHLREPGRVWPNFGPTEAKLSRHSPKFGPKPAEFGRLRLRAQAVGQSWPTLAEFGRRSVQLDQLRAKLGQTRPTMSERLYEQNDDHASRCSSTCGGRTTSVALEGRCPSAHLHTHTPCLSLPGSAGGWVRLRCQLRGSSFEDRGWGSEKGARSPTRGSPKTCLESASGRSELDENRGNRCSLMRRSQNL